jgi:hypothetical protein
MVKTNAKDIFIGVEQLSIACGVLDGSGSGGRRGGGREQVRET